MDMDRIERALREGPPDEPVYRPGAFRRPSRRRAWAVVALPVVAVTIALSLVIGSGIAAVREGGVGSAPDPLALSQALRGGVWVSQPLTSREWTGAVLARGFTPAQVSAFLEHDAFESTVQYRLTFGDYVLTIQGVYDDAAPVTLSRYTYEVRPDGTIGITEVVAGPAPAAACPVTVVATVDGPVLTTGLAGDAGCTADERLANTAFFDLAPYTRVSP